MSDHSTKTKYQRVWDLNKRLARCLNHDGLLKSYDELADICCGIEQERDELKAIAQRLVKWCEMYPSSRIYSESAIRKIAAEIDAIGADAAQTIAKTGAV